MVIAPCLVATSCGDSKAHEEAPRPEIEESAPPPRRTAGAATSTEPQTPRSAREIARATLPSVVLLILEDENQQPLAFGSGFAVGRELIVTNLHVVLGATSGKVKASSAQTRPLPISGIVASDRSNDLVLLRVSGLEIEPLPLADAYAEPEIGDRIYAAGNPKGLEGTFSEGVVSAKREADGSSILQITAPISPGSSGGPVVDKRGAVVGVSTATLTDGQNLNFAVGASLVRDLLGHTHDERPLSTLRSIPAPKRSTPRDGLRGAIAVSEFLWDSEYDFGDDGGTFTVSIRNTLPSPITEVRILVLFSDGKDLPIESTLLSFDEPIRPGLARLARAGVEPSIKPRVTSSNGYQYSRRPRKGRVTFRILDFELVK